MLSTRFTLPAMLTTLVAASSLPLEYLSTTTNSLNLCQKPCKNGPDSRHCWGNFSLETNYYQDIPNTGVTREYWFDVQNTTLAPDGYLQNVLTINGSIPGPTIIADWGDEVVIHVTNNMQFNGTTIHWHGIRQHNTNENDGVPGVTQCPIAPGQSYTYRWRAEQYGSSWYHSHFSFQYAAGLYGGIIINGPATANYDEDLGNLFLSDWGHIDPFSQWWWNRPKTGPPSQANSLINGTNVFDCTGSKNPNCFGNGTRFEMLFDYGKKYRLRLVNPSLYGHYRFAIDGHTMTVIANDFVPIKPYKTDNVIISMGQRYDIIVEANAKPDNYWLRQIWQRSCCDNDYWNNSLGIVRYNKHSTDLPKTNNSAVSYPDTCDDEPFDKLVPYMELNVPAPAYIPPLNLYFAFVPMPAGFLFTLNQSYIWVNFSAPTNLLLSEGVHDFPNLPYPNATGGGFTDYDAFELEGRDKWVYYAVQDISHRNRSHPFHLHGHDYYVLAQGSGNYTGQPLNLINPVRRDTATVPLNGYMVMAFKLDNPGSWLFHCHIAAHSSEGLGLQFVELENEITGTFKAQDQLDETCDTWGEYWKDSIYIQEDSGI